MYDSLRASQDKKHPYSHRVDQTREANVSTKSDQGDGISVTIYIELRCDVAPDTRSADPQAYVAL
jgi:hypothetical protein